MNENLVNWLKISTEEDVVYFNGKQDEVFVFYVPEAFFETNNAVYEGNIISVIGILNWAIIPKDADPSKYSLKAKPFTFPTLIQTKPGKIEKVKGLKIKESQKPQDFRIFYYENNREDHIIHTLFTVQDIVNVEKIMAIFETTGKIPPGISYYDLYYYYMEPMKINGSSYGVSNQVFGLLCSEICRDPDDYSKPFRLSKKLDKDPYCYNPVSIKQISKLISPFTSITTENWDKAVISAAIIDEKDIKYTPMEKIMMD